MLARILADKGDAAGVPSATTAPFLAGTRASCKGIASCIDCFGSRTSEATPRRCCWTDTKNNPKQYGFLLSLAEQYMVERRRDDMLRVIQDLEIDGRIQPGLC